MNEEEKWRNKLGHDSDSELQTILARMREGRFVLKSTHGNCVEFSIMINHSTIIPIPGRRTVFVDFRIYRDGQTSFSLEQLWGMPKRSIPMPPGYIIWSLLEEKFYDDQIYESVQRRKVKYFSWSIGKRLRGESNEKRKGRHDTGQSAEGHIGQDEIR